MRRFYRHNVIAQIPVRECGKPDDKYFKKFAAWTVSGDKALAYFATHPETVLGLFGLYCEESGVEK